jgi:hypothetical protein
MRKRRVGVTARSRQIVGNQATGFPQVVTEMAAPPELRTPMGTAAKAAIRVRMEAWRQWRWSRPSEGSPREMEGSGRSGVQGKPAADGALVARMRRCLILRQGASPLRPPAPFPSGSMLQNGGNLSRVRKPRKNGAPLTDSLRSEDSTKMRERGPSAKRAASRLPMVGPQQWDRDTGYGALVARVRRCLTLRQGASPLRPPPRHFSLDRDRPSHGSRDRQGVPHGPAQTKNKRLRPTKGDENDLEAVYDAGLERGVEEVVTALEKSRPLGSLTRMACCEPISVHCPTGKEGR